MLKCLMMIACLMGLAERDDAQLLELISYYFQLLVVVRKGEDTFTVLGMQCLDDLPAADQS